MRDPGNEVAISKVFTFLSDLVLYVWGKSSISEDKFRFVNLHVHFHLVREIHFGIVLHTYDHHFE